MTIQIEIIQQKKVEFVEKDHIIIINVVIVRLRIEQNDDEHLPKN